MHASSFTAATSAPRGHLPTLISSFLYFDTSFMVWVLLGALGNYIGEDLGLSIAQWSVLTAVPVLSGAALRIGASVLAEYRGRAP
ncbi:MAG: hypothetical protein EXR48_06215 [Dehalococcoidia bacterium]|nr:hypothetical protein [Dehalococcoidia bacterium]